MTATTTPAIAAAKARVSEANDAIGAARSVAVSAAVLREIDYWNGRACEAEQALDAAYEAARMSA